MFFAGSKGRWKEAKTSQQLMYAVCVVYMDTKLRSYFDSLRVFGRHGRVHSAFRWSCAFLGQMPSHYDCTLDGTDLRLE